MTPSLDSPRFVAGVLLVLIFALIPLFAVGVAQLPTNVWGMPLGEKLRTIAAHVDSWNGINRWFLASALLSTAGLTLVAWQLRGSTLGHVAAIGVVTYAIGSTLWIVELSSRLSVIAAAARETAQAGIVPVWAAPIATLGYGLFTVYAVLSNLAMIAVGGALLAANLVPAWAGWTAIGSGVVLLAGQLVTGDNIPAMNYIAPVVIGVALLLSK